MERRGRGGEKQGREKGRSLQGGRSAGEAGSRSQAAPSLASRPCSAPSDLALRNCLLTSDLTVRIGDYGLAHSNYKVGAALRQGGGRGKAPDPPDPAPARPPGGLLPDPRAPVDPAALGGA